MNENRPKILVVDDEPDICWALENILGPAGYAVTTSSCGKEALDLITAEVYAVVFVDAKLPDQNGLELAALIRQNRPETAVILISGYYYDEDSTIQEGMEQNLFLGFIAKPFDVHEVRLLARRALQFHRKGME